HLEFTYDFRKGGSGTGWLHAIGRYHHSSGHAAETSFGAHIFNLPDTYKGEPQSYSGPPPGLTTRIVLRLGTAGETAYCHLIYPSSGENWHPTSTTELTLHTAQAEKLASATLHIPQNGSKLWNASDFFSADLLKKAHGGYVQITDKTCRLFGYHGLKREQNQAFSLDHMFGF
ncbi:MAG: hypothetical protein EBR79_01445, partial [Proteobacteria bacterium]|nr:hypothetical protein [Pseudomonadota bacterium]